MADNVCNSQVSEMLARAAGQLDAQKEELLARWETRVRRDVPASRRQEPMLLRDHMDAFLRSVFKLFQASISAQVNEDVLVAQMDNEPSVTHGRLRATLPGYTVYEVIQEYIALRLVITEALRETQSWDDRVGDVLTAATEQAILQATSEFSEALNSLRERTVSMLMHDIRGPLHVVSLTAETLASTAEEHHSPADAILRSCGRIDGMLVQLLDAVRLTAGGGLDLQFEYGDLGQTVAGAVENAHYLYPGRVEYKKPTQAITGWFDFAGVTRTVENLISNAIKYGDPQRSISVVLSREDNDHARVTVHNWGEPITAQECETLFVPFHRGNSAKKLQVKGWGLGLAYAKAVADAHDGAIEIDSAHDSGTAFSVVLPLELTPAKST